ncbi:MAG TPA: radical SAM protein [Elusimicrobiales bacterium]|nr:radical SAM protein [Elusimicrobiales bacterium]
MRRPDHLSVYLTGSCDMACAYCFVPACRDALGRAGLFRALDSFARAGGRRVTFLGGEPLLRWGLLKAAVARLGRLRPPLHTTVFTNGALLDRDRAETLLRSGARVVVSLDGGRADNDKSRKLRAGGSAYAAALRGLPRPLRARLTASAVVTPAGAGRLAANVRALYSAGFRAIAWAPDIKAAWGPAEARVLSAELRRIGRDYAAMLRSGRPAYELANIYELLDLDRGADVSGCASLTLSPSVEMLPCDKLLAAPASVRRGYSGPAGRRRFFAEASAAGADPAEPLCPAGYYSLLRHARGLSPSETRAAMDLRAGFSRVYGAALLRLVRDLSRLPAFRLKHGLEAPL